MKQFFLSHISFKIGAFYWPKYWKQTITGLWGIISDLVSQTRLNVVVHAVCYDLAAGKHRVQDHLSHRGQLHYVHQWDMQFTPVLCSKADKYTEFKCIRHKHCTIYVLIGQKYISLRILLGEFNKNLLATFREHFLQVNVGGTLIHPNENVFQKFSEGFNLINVRRTFHKPPQKS